MNIQGKYASAIVYAEDIEDYAIAQVRQLCDQQAFEGSRIRIMPDCHPGKVGPIGFTATIGDKIMPAVMGIDIGCGMTIAKLSVNRVDFQKLDKVIRESSFRIIYTEQYSSVCR